MPLLPESQRTVVNGVDIDRLHWVIENRPLVQRGAGKTFARIQEFLEIVFGLKNDINVSIYAKPEFEYTQMDIIRDALISGIDVTPFANPIFDWEQMLEIKFGIQDRVDYSIYAKNEYNAPQMMEIRLGLVNGIDVSSYADPHIERSITNANRL